MRKTVNSKFGEIWINLYSTLTTSQIDKALRSSGMDWDDWMDFTRQMKALSNRKKKTKKVDGE